MTFKWFLLLPVVAAMSILPSMSFAQTSMCDPGGLEQEAALQQALPPSCKRERVQASGRVSFNIINSAEKIANEAWRREAVTKFGERFADTKYMACRRVLCVRGSIAGTKRCTISGFPCAADMNDQDKATIKQVELSQGVSPYGGGEGSQDVASGWGYHPGAMESGLDEEQIKHLQQLLGVEPDGDFGYQSNRALRDFRRGVGLPLEGPPTMADLEKAQRSERRNWGR
jgi:hypothetical protein